MILLANPKDELLAEEYTHASLAVNDNLVDKGEVNMKARVNTILTALTGITAGSLMVLMTGVAQQQMPQTTKESIKGNASVTTEQLNGTVQYVEGNRLVVRMNNGAFRVFDVPASRKFRIDGRDLTVHELKPGTKLSATVITTTTPVTERTTTVGTGTVWWVSGKTVVITLPNGENRTYTVTDDYKFNIEGNKTATVSDLRKGMKISAERIVEEPRTEITSNTVVTGQAPRK